MATRENNILELLLTNNQDIIHPWVQGTDQFEETQLSHYKPITVTLAKNKTRNNISNKKHTMDEQGFRNINFTSKEA